MRSGEDIDQRLASASSDGAKNYCVRAGVYELTNPLNFGPGDKVFGEIGATHAVRSDGRTATVADPVVRIVEAGNPDGGQIKAMLQGNGTIHMEWLDVRGAKGGYKDLAGCGNPSTDGQRCPAAGTGVALKMGSTNAASTFAYLELAHNDSNGMTGVSGVVRNSDVHHNAANPDFAGYTGGGIKSDREYEVAGSHVRQNETNGLWCDVGCVEQQQRPNGFWVRDNVIEANGWWGVRYEHAPMVPNRTAPDPANNSPSMLVRNNSFHGNGGARFDDKRKGGGVSVSDARHALVERNDFGRGQVSEGGTTRDYPNPEYNQNGVLAVDDNRTSFKDNLFRGNRMNGDLVRGCDLPGNSCSNNQ